MLKRKLISGMGLLNTLQGGPHRHPGARELLLDVPRRRQVRDLRRVHSACQGQHEHDVRRLRQRVHQPGMHFNRKKNWQEIWLEHLLELWLEILYNNMKLQKLVV